MTKRAPTFIVFLTTLTLTSAAFQLASAEPAADPAKPAARAPTPPADSSDSFQITMTAGKGRLGASVLEISPALRGHLGASADRGVLVDKVRADSPAARAGLRVGDVILDVDGDPTTSATDILTALTDRKKGEAVAIEILRAGQRTQLHATLTDDPGSHPMSPQVRTWFDHDGSMKDMKDMMEPFAAPTKMQRMLDAANKRIEELERRLDRLERH